MWRKCSNSQYFRFSKFLFKEPLFIHLRHFGGVGFDVEEVFSTERGSSRVEVVSWGFLGEVWPFFRPNFVNMEKCREAAGVDEVGCQDSGDETSSARKLLKENL